MNITVTGLVTRRAPVTVVVAGTGGEGTWYALDYAASRDVARLIVPL